MGISLTIGDRPLLVGNRIHLQSRALRLLLPWLVLGFAGLLLTAASLLWQIWTGDALRSIGVYFPIVSAVLTLRVWRRLDWETRGTWWGLLPLYYATVMAREGGSAFQVVAFTQQIGFTLLPLGLTVFAYASGIVLLLGGARVWRAALFPLVLLLFVNPVPKIFQLVDLPLQFVCARVAQSFALAIGVHPDVSQLRLMFAPSFGMFIAPGCDGIRGAVTMAYLALILGYLYRFSTRARVFSAVSAVALGYLLNLIRLCLLVLFYRIALSFPSLQPHGEGADYFIGGLLFLVAAASFASVVRRNKPKSGQLASTRMQNVDLVRENGATHSIPHWKGAVASLLVVVSLFSSVRDLAVIARGRVQGSELASSDVFPTHMGKYRMQRTWSEQDWLGHLAYRWAAYLDDSSGTEIDIALWLGPGVHYPIACHVSQGQRPAWQQVSKLPAAQGGSATFALYFYDDSGGRSVEATTVCQAGGCNEQVLLPPQTGLAFASMGAKSLLFHPTSTPLPIVIRMQSSDLSVSSADTKARMLRDIQDFISQLNTYALVSFAESRNR